jgi:hypothetical protein
VCVSSYFYLLLVRCRCTCMLSPCLTTTLPHTSTHSSFTHFLPRSLILSRHPAACFVFTTLRIATTRPFHDHSRTIYSVLDRILVCITASNSILLLHPAALCTRRFAIISLPCYYCCCCSSSIHPTCLYPSSIKLTTLTTGTLFFIFLQRVHRLSLQRLAFVQLSRSQSPVN